MYAMCKLTASATARTRARAFHNATDKARELGWIVRGVGQTPFRDPAKSSPF